VGKCHITSVTASHHMVSRDRHGKEVHRPCSSYIESNRNSIEFSLSNANKGVVGLIPALELASLTFSNKHIYFRRVS